MKTEFRKPDKNAIQLAAELLRNGEIVAIPTETVYGIAGDASNPEAIKKIFAAKGRPQDNPLIVHISDMSMLSTTARFVPDDALKLADAFWPGPLTIIMPKSDKISAENCAGLDSVGIRMPSDPVAHAIIEAAGIPLGAPSANLSGKPSPTNALDVLNDMDGRLPLIIDGGECFCGVESTVVSVLEDKPVLLRPGYITKEEMEEVLGKEVILSAAILEKLKDGEKPRSPGMKYKHYAPLAEVTILDGSFSAYCSYIEANREENTFALCFSGDEAALSVPSVSYGAEHDGASQAHMLFSALRELDRLGAKKVYARCPDRDGVSLAVFNRLIRAAGFRLIKT